MATYDLVVSETVIEQVIEKLESEIRNFAESIINAGINIDLLKEVLELREAKDESSKSKSKEKFSQIDYKIKILSTAALLLVDAMLFHEILASTIRIPTLSQIYDSANIKMDLKKAWLGILEKNYEPIFDLVLKILDCFPVNKLTIKAIRQLMDISMKILQSTILLKHDLFGRIYHKLLLGKLAKYFATYYTSLPAARLLARLLINLPANVDYQEPKPKFDGADLRIVDFACGSGTLLSAMYKEIDLRHRLESSNPDPDKLHEYLISEGLWGFDVLEHATHLAATTLFLHNPSKAVSYSRIYTLPLGIFNNQEFLGSIDFLTSAEIKPIRTLYEELIGAERIGIEKKEKVSEKLPSFHYVIMNPPFTRSVGGNLLFGGLPKEQRKKLQEKLKKILRNKGISGIGKAGLGAVFVFIGDKYLLRNGRMGLVLPKGVLSGVSWKKVREMFLENYHIEYVISSFEAPDNFNFSENTKLAEVLLVLRKKSKNSGSDNPRQKYYTLFVNLWRKPRNEIEAITIGSQLVELYNSAKIFDLENSNASIASIRLKGKKIGEVYSVVLSHTNFGMYTVFAQGELNRIVALLSRGIIYTPKKGIIGHIPLVPLRQLIDDIGPDRSQIHDVFKRDPTGEFKAFWGHSADEILSIEAYPNERLKPKSGKANIARNLWQKSGRLLVVEKILPSKYRLTSVLLSENVLSNVWWPIKTDEETAKILALWFNSTFGIMLLLSIAEFEGTWIAGGPWFNIKKENLFELPVIDINRLTKEQRELLLSQYSEISKLRFGRIPDEFNVGSNRNRIDKLFSKVLQINVPFDEIYELLKRDPTITSVALP